MNIIDRKEKPNLTNVMYYICKDNNSSEVLFSTLGGIRFVCIKSTDSEWQSPMRYYSLDEAVAALKVLHDKQEKIATAYQLQIVKITKVQSEIHELYEPMLNNSEFENFNIVNKFESFEEFYHKNINSSKDLKSLRVYPEHNKGYVGYSDNTVNKALLQFSNLVYSFK